MIFHKMSPRTLWHNYTEQNLWGWGFAQLLYEHGPQILSFETKVKKITSLLFNSPLTNCLYSAAAQPGEGSRSCGTPPLLFFGATALSIISRGMRFQLLKKMKASHAISRVTCEYGGTPPYGHLGNTVTLLLRPLFSGPAKQPYNFLLKNPVNVVTR